MNFSTINVSYVSATIQISLFVCRLSFVADVVSTKFGCISNHNYIKHNHQRKKKEGDNINKTTINSSTHAQPDSHLALEEAACAVMWRNPSQSIIFVLLNTSFKSTQTNTPAVVNAAARRELSQRKRKVRSPNGNVRLSRCRGGQFPSIAVNIATESPCMDCCML